MSSSDTAGLPDAGEFRRLPLTFLVAEWGSGVWAMAGLVFATVVLGQLQSTPGWVTVAIGVLLALRLIEPCYSWATVRYAVDRTGACVTSGLLRRRSRRMDWSDVSAVQVDQPWAYRLMGLARVGILQGGEAATRLELVGIPVAVADQIAKQTDYMRTVGDAPPVEPPPVAAVQVPMEHSVVYRASGADLLVASLMYGRFALVGAGIAAASVSALQTWGLQDDAARVAAASPVLAAAVVGVVVLLTGAIATAVRYAGLQTTIGDEVLTINYGRMATRERVIRSEAVVGVEVRRNVLELATGRARLSVLTRDSADRLGSNLVLPSLRAQVVNGIVAATFADRIDTGAVSLASRKSAMFMTAAAFLFTVTTAGGVAAGAASFTDVPPLGIAAVFITVIATVAWSGRLVSSKLVFRDSPPTVLVTTIWMSDRQLLLAAAEVQVVSSMRAPLALEVAVVHYYAGAPRAIPVTRFPSRDLAATTRGIIAQRATTGGGAW